MRAPQALLRSWLALFLIQSAGYVSAGRSGKALSSTRSCLFHSKKYRSHFSGNISRVSWAEKCTEAKRSYAWRAYLNIDAIWLQSVTRSPALNMEHKDKTRLQDGRFFSRGMKGKPWLAKHDCKKKARSCLRALVRIQKIYYVCRFRETCSWQQEDFIPEPFELSLPFSCISQHKSCSVFPTTTWCQGMSSFTLFTFHKATTEQMEKYKLHHMLC